MSIIDKIRSDVEGELQVEDTNTSSKELAEFKPVDIDVNQVKNIKPKIINLNSEDRKLVNKIKDNIDLFNPQAIQSLDDGINNNLNKFNTTMLEKAKVSDLHDCSPLIVEVVNKAKNFNPNELNETNKGLLSRIFKKPKNAIANYKMKFETVQKQFDEILLKLQEDIKKQKQSILDMEQLYQINIEQYNDLKLLIVATEEKIQDLEKNFLPELEKKAKENTDDFSIQKYQNAISGLHILKKKLSDMNLLRMDCIQTAQIVYIIQSNSYSQIESTNQTINGAIQQWKRGVTIALTLRDQKLAADRDKLVRDANNEIRKRTAEMLEQTSVIVTQNAERGSIDYETLEDVHKNLLSTMEKVYKIQSDGRLRREDELKKLIIMEDNFKKAIINNGERNVNNLSIAK